MDINQVGLLLTGLSLLVGLATLLFPDEVRGLKFSIRLLGILGLMIGLILIVVAARGGGSANGQGSGTTTSANSTVVNPTTTTISAPSSTDSTEGSATRSASVRWQERIRIPQAFYVNLDDTEPRVGGSVPNADMYSSTDRNDTTASFYTYGSVGSAPAGGPSFASCRSAVETAALGTTFEIEPGAGFCMRTRPNSGDPHIAHAKVLAIDQRTGAVTLDVTVWRQEP
jgi:hypothetical protein